MRHDWHDQLPKVLCSLGGTVSILLQLRVSAAGAFERVKGHKPSGVVTSEIMGATSQL